MPSNADFEKNATCPNGNWTKSVQAGSITLSTFTYSFSFQGFSGAFITMTPDPYPDPDR